MELVYLWIEDYKNIKRQGFTFSPRFKCEFKPKYNEKDELIPEESELIIEEKKDYVNIFPDNINVTAIVGKNGAGKSSVLEILSDFILQQNNKNIIIFYNKKNHSFYSSNENIKIKNNLYSLKKLNFSKIKAIFYSSNFTNGKFDEFYDFFSGPLIIYSKNINLRNQSLLNLFVNSFRILSNHSSKSASYNKDAFTIFDIIQNYKTAKSILITHFLNLNSFIFDLFEINKEFFRVEIRFDWRIVNLVSITPHQVQNYEQVFNAFFDKIIFNVESDLDNEENNAKLEIFKRKKEEFISFLRDKKLNDVSKDESLIFDVLEASIFLNLFLQILSVFYNKIDKNLLVINFPQLSSGEESLILMFALIENAIKSFKKNETLNIICMFDEVENNFHPKWQIELIKKVLKFIKIINYNLFENSNSINFDLIFTTHSPFILSDLPKENIIFMKEGRNVSDEVEIETFGANIHTLLTHGFFMEDGLMGEYAKEKINDVINYIRAKKEKIKLQTSIKNDKEAEFIINHIGEPFLKEKLNEMFLGTLSELDILKKRKEEIEKKIKELENAKSK